MLNKKQTRIVLFSLLWIILLIAISCAHKSGHNKKGVVERRRSEKTEIIKTNTQVRMHKENGVYYVPVNVNGLDLNFIFDTGASDISISSAEALVMLRNGKLTDEDFVGEMPFQDATGTVSVGSVVILRTVKIGDATIENVEATVVDNIQAPLLLGQTALSKFGRVAIDYDNNIIEFE